MMYMGSKCKVGKRIINTIISDLNNSNINPKDCTYAEPFVGALGSMCKTDGLFARRYGFDANEYLISLWSAMQKGYIPPKEISPEQYKHTKDNKDYYEKALVAFVGFGCSFGGKWFGGYAKDKSGRNYAREASESRLDKILFCKGVIFHQATYENSICWRVVGEGQRVLYCDPPYLNTVKYSANKESFDHRKFWQWCVDRVKAGDIVYVSEYSVPDEFAENVVEILRFERKSTLRSSELSGRVDVERLFKLVV